MRVLFIGSQESRNLFQSAIAGHGEITSEKNADLCVIEIAEASTLFRLPKKFSVPTFFYITKKDRQLLDALTDFKISGIFFPPLKPEEVVKKMFSGKVQTSTANGSEFDTLKAKIIAKAENIPPLPALARELVRLTRNDKTKIKDFVDQIKKDQGLSSRIIKLVNSPFYGVRQEISSIDRATVLLGLNTVKNLALAVSTESFYNKNFSLLKTTGQKIWQHGFAVARLCEAIAKLVGEDEDALYLAGLMHDMGKTVIVDFLVKEAVTIEDERNQLGTDHCAVGELVLTKWAVVKSIAESVRYHHQLGKDTFSRVLYFANQMHKNIDDTEALEDTISDCALALGLPLEKLHEAVDPVLDSEKADNDIS
ncbi:HDOD domain-containing protein [Seleniivibrio sp.]|uniref:HDOD domain-containing protein n=1 Tax=Seleniivibrio sp. TaxID=2898801 RepID=UPI0025E6E9AB|nr:HDOD domain-containing protein [Seleniivibrio sp.]MCD8554142.1 HDOD domain-containing protein [Seleniivibrio sp.]